MLTKLNKIKTFKNSWDRLRQIRMHKIHKFTPKIPIEIKVGSLVLKTVTEKFELIEALKLRYEVFFEEMQGKTKGSGIDVDEYDAVCDHLIIVDTKKDKIVGTYRLNCSKFSDDYYSANEFHLDRLMRDSHVKVELGRACIHKDYRKGAIISVLWRGIAEYMNMTSAQYLFGCGSVKTKDPFEAALIYKYLQEENRITERFYCPTTKAFTMPGFTDALESYAAGLTEEQRSKAKALIPPLFGAYLRAGADVCGEPAWDIDFQCIDFLTLLDRQRLNGVHSKRYSVDATLRA